MTKRDRRRIALLWAGSLIFNSDSDTFDEILAEEDARKVFEHARQIGVRLIERSGATRAELTGDGILRSLGIASTGDMEPDVHRPEM